MTIRDHLFVFLWLVMVCGVRTEVSAQGRSVRDSVLFSPYIQVHGGVGSSAGDLGLRYGTGGHVGAGAHVKTAQNWFFGPSQLWIWHGVEGIGGAVKFAHAHRSID